MAWQLISVSTNSQVALGITDDAIIAPGVTVTTSGIGVNADGSGHTALIYGSVISASTGVYLGNGSGTGTDQYALIADTGSVAGGFRGVVLSGMGSHLVNHGSISGDGFGVSVNAASPGNVTLFNDGMIDSAEIGVARLPVSGVLGAIILRNYGTITGGIAAFEGDIFGSIIDGADRVINRGTMIGAINLGGGNDSYDGRGGTVDGIIRGGDGNDRFLAGAAAETIDGGAGVNTLDFRFDTAVRVALDHSIVNTGSARNDNYSNIDIVVGSDSGADYIVGDAGVNKLFGMHGNDSLFGGQGGDTLVGESGSDYLRGGSGNDWFEFFGPKDGGDKIADFANVTGNNDGFILSLTGFAAGLTAGTLAAAKFYHGTTNICTGADDRIIVRTTDNTVWFDSNGKAAGGLTMLADLQAGVVITAADFMIG